MTKFSTFMVFFVLNGFLIYISVLVFQSPILFSGKTGYAPLSCDERGMEKLN